MKKTKIPQEPVPLMNPSPQTLAKYGLSFEGWRKMADEQGEACFVCKKKPMKGRLCIDHHHAPGWKKMSPDQRVLWVRGLLCFMCNTQVLGRCVTVEKLRNATLYLELFEARRPQP
jgi:hypothetical protein